MTRMQKPKAKSTAAKRATSSKKAQGKVKAKSPTSHPKASLKASSKKTISRTHHRENSDTTYVFECTRPGCGYRLPREEKAEQGSLRFDLKCPKCHNKEFKCLGKGDLPEGFELHVPSTNIDLDSIRPVDLGSN
jgi:Zn finger protein HypA/HybF involved in hydrogenase expression